MKTTKELFVGNLCRLRPLFFKTQADIAEKLGMTANGYQKYEQGAADPDTEMLDRLAKLLDTSPTALLSDQHAALIQIIETSDPVLAAIGAKLIEIEKKIDSVFIGQSRERARTRGDLRAVLGRTPNKRKPPGRINK